MTTALIDGDIVCYKSCFSAEYDVYDIPSEGVFEYKREVDEFIDWNYDVDEGDWIQSTIIKKKVLEPFEQAEFAARQIIKSVLERTGLSEYELYISGDNNFRKSVPYPVVYKGNRSQPKPFYYERMRKYLIEHEHAMVVDGLECDDMLSIRQHELKGDSIIASIDKDLKQVPGKHFNLDSKEITTINETQAFRNFGIQLLIGDRIDNIIGCPGVGIKTAEKILKGLTTQEAIYGAIKQQYQKSFGGKWNEMFTSNLKLVLLRTIRQ